MPRVSVIMSVYEEPLGWIQEAIDSILVQTFRDFEFIIVNDNPKREDNDIVLNEYQQKDARVIFIANEINIGLTRSLNRALSVARGEYVARMDADDLSLPQRLEKQVSYLDAHPDICCVGSWTGKIDEHGIRMPEITKYETDPCWVKAQFLQNSQVGHPVSMFRRMVKDITVKYDESFRYAQDYALWVSLLPYGAITNIPDVLFCYRISDRQISSNRKVEQQKCAREAQKRAFALYDFPATSSFLSVFSAITIQHDMDLLAEEVNNEFRQFFRNVKLTRDSSLALEVIYGTYLSFLQERCRTSRMKFAKCILRNSSPFMLFLGCRLGVHLAQRKVKRQ